MRNLLAMCVVGCSADGPTTGNPDVGDSDADTDADTDSDTDADTDTDTGPCGPAPAFGDPGATDYLQWSVDDTEYVFSVPYPRQILFNGFFSIGGVDDDTFESMGVAMWGQTWTNVPAGVYTCDADAQVLSNTWGDANQAVPGSACEVVFDQDVVDGGRAVGRFWGVLVDGPTTCVHGRFSMGDAAAR